MDTPGVRQVREGSGERGNMNETGCELSVVPQDPHGSGIDHDDADADADDDNDDADADANDDNDDADDDDEGAD